MRKKIPAGRLFSSLLVVGSLALVGCTNNDYDFNQVDLTIGIGGDSLVIPTSSTENIKLSDVLKLEENGSVKFDNDSNYVFQLAGNEVAPARPQVDPVVMQGTHFNPTFTFDVASLLPNRAARTVRRAVTESAKQKIFEYHGVSDAVNALYRATVAKAGTQGRENMQIKLNLKMDGLNQVISKIGVMRLSMPGYLDIQSVESGSVKSSVRTTDNGQDIVLEGISTAQALQVVIRVAGLNFNDTPTAYGQLAINQATHAIDLDGWFSIYLDPSTIEKVPTPAVTDKVSIEADVSVDHVEIRKAEGKFDPTISLDNLGEVDVTGVPDFLTDGNVIVDLYNPQILLTVDNNMEVAAKVGGTLNGKVSRIIASKNGVQTAAVDLPEMSIHKNGRTQLCICRQKTAELVNAYGEENVYEVADLSDLVRKIPDHVKIIHANAKTDLSQTASFEFGRQYEVKPAYEVLAPVAFAKDANIVYKDSVDNLNDDLKDLELADNSYVLMTADVETLVPAYLSVNAYPVDINGRRIGSDRISVEIPNRITASDGTTPARSQLIVKLSQKQKGAIKQLDKFVFEVQGAASEGQNSVVGVTLNAKKHTLKLNNIKVKVVGKVVGDFN